MQSGTTAAHETHPSSDLDSRYGDVGISAVAAALPYQSDAKNSAYARVEEHVDERFLNDAT